MTTEPKFDNQTLLASELLGARVHQEDGPKKRPYKMNPKKNKNRGRHLEEHQWKKGQSGNPKGRPVKNLSLVSLIKEHLEWNPEDAQSIALALIGLAKKRDPFNSGTQLRAIEELMNRIDGKVAETHKIEGQLPIRLIFVPAQQVIGVGKKEVVEGEVKELADGNIDP